MSVHSDPSPANDTSFDDVLRSLQPQDGHFIAEVPALWAQGRATFGGLIAALAVRTATNQLKPEVAGERSLRSLLVSFVGPVAPGPAQVEASTLRHGRSSSTFDVKVTQDGSVRAAVLACFGASRASGLNAAGPTRPEAAAVDTLASLPFLPGITPRFTQCFEFRWALGSPPFCGATERRMGGWFRLRDMPDAVTSEHVIALADAWPAPVLPMLTAPAPASSMTWQLDLLPIASQQPSPWWFLEAHADAAAEGYAQVRATLWAPDGSVAAFSRQTVAVFD